MSKPATSKPATSQSATSKAAVPPLAFGPIPDERTRTEVEAAAFRRLVEHLQSRTDVQNIDLMNLAGFCRNCLSKWYTAAATERGESLELETTREWLYGMPYSDWKSKYQTGTKSR